MGTAGWGWLPLLFLGAWAGALYLLARAGGWAALARLYRLEESFDGDRWRFQSGQMRWTTNYGGILTVGANRRGLYLAVFLPFRFGHPPLFIPWTETSVREIPGRVFTYHEFAFRRVPGVPLRVSERLARRIASAAGPSWPGPGPAEDGSRRQGHPEERAGA